MSHYIKKQARAELLAIHMQGKHSFWVTGVQLWPNLPNILKKLWKPITLSPSVTLFRSRIDRISKRIFSTTNYFNQQWLSLSSSYWRSQKTSLGIINIRSKKKYNVQKYVLYYTTSKHICLEQFSIRFGWIWLDAHACMWHRNLYKYSITNQGQQKQFSSSTVSKYARYESSSGKMLLTFPLVSTPCLYWDSGNTEDKIWR